MRGETNHNGSSGHQNRLTIEIEVLAYELIEDCKDEFKGFYNKEIRKWLDENCVAYADAWIVGKYLVVVASQNPPWRPKGGQGGIPGLERYVKSTNPVPLERLERFTLSPGPRPSAARHAGELVGTNY